MDFTPLHLLALIMTVPVIAHADHMGFQYFRGTVETLPLRSVKWTHRLVFAGLLLLIATGVVLVLPAWEVWFSRPVFYVKLAFVVTLLMNGLFIERLMLTATERPFRALLPTEKRVLLVSGALSGMSWAATVLIGLFFL